MTSDFLLLIMHGLVVKFPDSLYSIYISQLVRFAECCTSVLKKISKLLQNCWHRVGTDVTRFEKHLESSLIILRTSVKILWYFVPRICVKRNLSPGLLRWSNLQTKEGQRHAKFHFVELENSQTPSTTTVWPIDYREDYRSWALPFYSLVRTFPEALHSNKAVGTIWRALSKPPQKRQGPDPRPLWLLAELLRPPNLTSLLDGRSTACPIRMSLYIIFTRGIQ